MKNKNFDCVEMKRRGAQHVYNIIKDMTREQELEYWRVQTELMRARQALLRAAKSNPPERTAS